MATLPIEQILAFPDKTPIPGIEGVIVSVFPPKRGEGQYGPWVLQDINLKDDKGHEIKAVIGDEELVRSTADKGKRIRFTSTAGEKGINGVKVDHNNYKGKTTIRLKITGAANAEWVTGAGSVPVPRGPSEAPSSPATASQQAAPPIAASNVPAQQGANVQAGSSSVDSVETRIICWFDCYKAVVARQKEVIPDGLDVRFQMQTPELKDVATTIFLSFKGQYGVYARPLFAGECSLPKEEVSRPQSPEAPPPSVDLNGWREKVHPTTKKKLGDYEPAALRLIWAKMLPKFHDGSKAGTPAGDFFEVLNAAALDLKWETLDAANALIEDHLQANQEIKIDSKTLNEFCKSTHEGRGWNQLTEHDLLEIIGDVPMFLSAYAAYGEDSIPL